MRAHPTLAAIGLVLSSAAAAQSLKNASAAGHAALQAGRYLDADRLLRSVALNDDGSIRDEGEFGSWEQIHPMLTGETPIDDPHLPSASPPSPSSRDVSLIAVAMPRDAIAEITQRAQNTSIVILNEAHDSPRDRAFALAVAKALRSFGYSFLAAETFSNESWEGFMSPMDKLKQDGFVRFDTGYYTADPVFAAFVREALAIGYQPISYEQTMAQAGTATDRDGGIATREEAETQNLRAFLRSHPGAKILIHVGYSHAAEAPIGAHRTEWMAARLKRETGIDPLTIDQTTLTDTSSDRALYISASARIDRPSVFMTGDTPLVLGQYAGAVDLQVVHPRRTYRYGRPAWLASLGGHPIAIPPALLPAKGERLVQAFAADAPADAVPLDQVLVEAGKPAPMLMVPSGKLRFAVQDPR